MFCRRTAAAALLLLAVLPVACRRSNPPGVTRLALLPIENQTGDPSWDWVSGAAPGVLASLLAPAPGLHAAPAAERAQQALRGYLTLTAGRLRVFCVLEDLERKRVVKSIAAAAPAGGGILPLLNDVARALSDRARPYPSQSEESLRRLAQASGAGDYQQAVEADPDCGLSYLAWARWLASRGDREDARKVLETALARGGRVAPIERAELSALAASLRGDRESQLRALRELAQLTPSDARLARGIGAAELAQSRFEPAILWLRRAAQIEPDNAELWNEMAYAQAYAGDFENARKSAGEYIRLAPDNPNPLDSRGEIEYLAGDFAAAEKDFLAARQKSPAWQGGAPLLKAAHARLMSGDVAGADGLLGQYLEFRASLKDPLAVFTQAQWEFSTGRRKQAMARLEAFRAANQGELAARAATQLGVWKWQTGDRAAARQLAAGASRQAVVLQFVTQPPATAGEWALRAERAFPQPAGTPVKRYALAYALLGEKHFHEAAVLLRQMLRETSPLAAGDLRALAGWALLETGQIEEARPLLALYPLPAAQGDPAFASLIMPRFLLLRARLAAPGEAERLRALHAKLQ
ncbi:MAG: hypothetical protein HY822_08020 [Acidobacteria bacterium]|nr:hypothetical protein [Acidobacteriota bacterium]